MKKLVIGLMFFSTFSVFAQTQTVQNTQAVQGVQNVPKESFKPSPSAEGKPESYHLNKEVNKDVSKGDAQTQLNNPNVNHNNINVNQNTNPNGTAKSMAEIQNYSSQSTEEYMKRRNTMFQGSLSRCVNQLPKNKKGERSSEAMVKCAESKATPTTSKVETKQEN